MDSNAIANNTMFTQNITFSGSDTENSAEIIASEVTVNCSPGVHSKGSSKVKLTNVVNFNWELRFYVGQLIAAHVGGKVIAYGMKGSSPATRITLGKPGGMVRVTNVETNQRTLIKEMTGSVEDIAFALIPQQIVLGCVDNEGSLYVYSIDDGSESITYNLLLHVVHSEAAMPSQYYRIIWCPYIPSYGEDSDTIDDPAKLLVFLNGSKAEIWDVSVINSRYGMGPLQPREDYEGCIEICGHTLDIVDAAFSPDGTALATASLDGFVNFFQVYMVESEKKPKCLHEWKPHEGKAVSSLMFLDNVNEYGPDSRFWKFVITGSNYNSELKIWSCESWTCYQKIRFIAHPHALQPQLFLKTRLDMTGEYLMLSDINNRILYVLRVQKNDAERVANVSSISEFLVPASFLSFCITNAEVCKIQCSGSSEDLYLGGSNGHFDEDEESNVAASVIKMYVVQPARLQECTITFQPENSSCIDGGVMPDVLVDNNCVSKIDSQLDAKKDELVSGEIPNLNDLQSSVSLLIQQQNSQGPHLMTPDAFSSPGHTSSPINKQTSLESEEVSPIMNKSLEKVCIDSEDLLQFVFERPQKENFASGGSSPSREVQEILSIKSNQDFFDDLKIENGDHQKKLNQSENLVFTENISNEVVWPNIPIVKANEITKEENRRQELQLAGSSDAEDDLKYHQVQLHQVDFRLNTLEDLINKRNDQIEELQADVRVLSQTIRNDIREDIRNVFTKELDLALSRSQLQQAKVFENFVNLQKNREYEQEKLVASISQIFNKHISEKLPILVTHDIKQSVLPPVLSMFEGMKHQLAVEYSQKLNTTDLLLKDNIMKLVHSKSLAESLSLAVVSMIKPSMEQCYKEMISATLVPSWERVCSTMFQQIHETFTKGTKEYTASVESYMDRQRRVQDKGKDLIAQMQSVSESMKNNCEKLTRNLSQEIERQLVVSFDSMHERLTNTIVELVSDQVNQGFKSHAATIEDSVLNAVRSRAVTPSPHVIDTQVHLTQIQQLLAKGHIDVAFQQALSASDLSLVVYVCEKITPQEAFGLDGGNLPQPVILSLIQQLSADLTRNTELKHRYLQEALLYLETSNTLTKEHMPKVLRELHRQISMFLVSHPTHQCARNMRVLQMATQSLIN